MKAINFNKIVLLLLGLVVFNACVEDDDFDTPNTSLVEPTLDAPVITIDQLFDLYEQDFLGFIDDLGLDPNNPGDADEIEEARENYRYSLENDDNFISGYVVSNDEAGNFFEELIIQNNANQGSAGVRVMIDVNPLFVRYQFGQLVYIKLIDLHIGISNGVLTLGKTENLEKIPRPQENDFIFRSPQVEEIVPTEITFDQLDSSLENVFVRLNNVQFNRDLVLGDDPVSYAGEPEDEFDGERLLESCDENGSSIIVSTSTFADFKSLPLPTGQGSISGILTNDFFGEVFNLAINTPEDIEFGGIENRCDPLLISCGTAASAGPNNLFADDFEGQSTFQPISGNGWTNYIQEGTETWEAYTSGGSNASQGISARVGAFQSGDDSSIAWLITPQIDLDANPGATLQFETSNSFSDGSILELLISNDWDGTEAGVTSATWGILTDAYITQDSDSFSQWFESGIVDLSCASGQVYIAFKYTGSGQSDFDGTYELDFVSIDAQ